MIPLFKVFEQVTDPATGTQQQKGRLIHVSKRFGLVFAMPGGRIIGQWCWQNVDHVTIKDRYGGQVNITHEENSVRQRKKFVFAGPTLFMDMFFESIESCTNADIEKGFLFWKKKCILKTPLTNSTPLPANVTNLTQLARLLRVEEELQALIQEYERQQGQELGTIQPLDVPTEAQQRA